MRYQSLFISLYAVSLLMTILIPGAQAAETYAFQWAVPSVEGIHSPYGIASDTAGNIYATDHVNDSIWKFGPDGSFQMKWGSPGTGNGTFNNPAGIAVNSSGFVYIADTNNHRIQRFTTAG